MIKRVYVVVEENKGKAGAPLRKQGRVSLAEFKGGMAFNIVIGKGVSMNKLEVSLSEQK